MRSCAAVAALFASRADAIWTQTQGGRFRAGVFPPTLVESSSAAEISAALAHPRTPRLPPRAGAPAPRDPAANSPYNVVSIGVRRCHAASLRRLLP